MKLVLKSLATITLLWAVSQPSFAVLGPSADREKRLLLELESCTNSSQQIEIRLELAELMKDDDHRIPGNPLDQGGDDCLTATDISGMLLPLVMTGTTEGYVNNFSVLGLGPLAPECWSGYYSETQSCGGPDVCYNFTAPLTANYRLTLCGSLFDTGLLIYNFTCPTNPINPLDFICGNDDLCGVHSEIPSLPLFAGQTVLIVVDGWGAGFGSYQLMISETPPPPPNDDCFLALDLPIPSTVSGSTIGASSDDVIPCGTTISAPGVWYSVFGTGNELTASTCGGYDYDTKINVYTGGCAAPICVGGNDDACGLGLGSRLTWSSVPGQPYQILVQGFEGQTGEFELSISEDVVSIFEECVPVTGDEFFPASLSRGSEVVNACFDPVGPYNFYGRSFLIGHNEVDGFHVHLQTLDRYETYGMIPDFQDLVYQHDPIGDISGFTIIERIVGSEAPEELLPTLLFESGDPLIVLLSEQGQYLKVSTLADTLVLGPYFMSELGYVDRRPAMAAVDNDSLGLFILMYALDGVNGDIRDLAYVRLHFDSADDPPTPHPMVSISDLIGTRPVLDMDFIEGQNSLLLLLDNPREALHIDVNNPFAPFFVASTMLDNNTWTLSASEGFCDLEGAVGQWVATRDVEGLTQVCTTPCAPSPIPMPYPAFGNYLEPRVGFNFAADVSESINGPIGIYAWIEGPWWPENVRGLYSFDNATFAEFDLDTNGMISPEITFADSGMPGDGWVLLYTPNNETEQQTWIKLCYEIERNGTLIYVQDSINIQDELDPEIITPENDGNPVPQGGTGDVVQPDDSEVVEGEVERREIENPISEDIEPIPQVQDDLPPWWYVRWIPGVPPFIPPIPYLECIPGGGHCAPTATIQQIIALADNNPCLKSKLACYLGYGIGVTPASFTEADIVRLIRLMGYCMDTHKGECGSRFEKTVAAIEKFLRHICLEAEIQCDDTCHPHIYAHFISSGVIRGAWGFPVTLPLDWKDVQEEFEEKKQTISLRLKKNGQDMTHRVSVVSITVRPDGKIELEVADPAYPDDTYTMVIDPSTRPPTIIDDGQPDEDWNVINAAIAISDTTPAEDGGRQAGNDALDQEYFTWEPVLSVAGPVTSFPYENLTPGWWKYRVRVYTAAGDSATAYKTVYVPEPLDLTAIREGDDLVLRWDPEPWAIQYIVQKSLTPTGAWTDLATTTLPTLTTEYNSTDSNHYRVIAVFGP